MAEFNPSVMTLPEAIELLEAKVQERKQWSTEPQEDAAISIGLSEAESLLDVLRTCKRRVE